MSKAQQKAFQQSLTRALRTLPFRTPRGRVIKGPFDHYFGTTQGPHDLGRVWHYAYGSSGHGMYFGFVPYFDGTGFFTTAFDRGAPGYKVGASIQFPTGINPSVLLADGKYLILRHGGSVTVGRGAVRRDVIADNANRFASEALSLLRIARAEGPLDIGSTRDLADLLDRLFLYSFALEQAKRAVTRVPAEAARRRVRERRPLRSLLGDDDVAPDDDVVPHGGSGHALTQKQREAVAERAVVVAAKIYKDRGYTIRRRGKPFDLECTRAGERLDVEVKGSTGQGPSFELTTNEVEHARSHSMALVLVTGIQLDDEDRASGGRARVVEPWRPDDHSLAAVRFVCVLRDHAP